MKQLRRLKRHYEEQGGLYSGEERMGQLMGRLFQDNRLSDAARAAENVRV